MGGVPEQKNELEAFLVASATVLNVHRVNNLALIVQDKESMCFFNQVLLSLSIDIDIIHEIK